MCWSEDAVEIGKKGTTRNLQIGFGSLGIESRSHGSMDGWIYERKLRRRRRNTTWKEKDGWKCM